MRPVYKRNGFTLVELLVSLAISSMILGLVVTGIFQTSKVNTQSRNSISAFEDISLTVEKIIPDVKAAQITQWYDGGTPTLLEDEDTPVDNLILDWTSWYDNTVVPPEFNPIDCRVEYTFLVDEGKIQRKYWRHKRSDLEIYPDYWQTYITTNGADSTTTFGNYISDIEFSRHGIVGGNSYVLVDITSSPEESTESAESLSYQISLMEMEEVPST